MISGEGSPDQLHASLYGLPVDPEQALQQSEGLKHQLAAAEDRRNIDEISRVESELQALYEAHPSLRDADVTIE
jgi:hypothetical protein